MRKEVRLKNVMGIFMIFILLGGLYSFFIYKEYCSIKKINVNGFSSSDLSIIIDSIENSPQNKIVSIRGWAFKKNENLKKVETYIALKSKKTSEVFRINTVKEVRKDVTLYYHDSYNHDNCGYFAAFDKNELKDKGEYEICILYLSDNNNNFVPTGKFLEIN